MGSNEALKQYALEHHSVREMLNIIKVNNLEEEVDLVSGGHWDLFFTEEELAEAKSDFDLARDAGSDLDYVQWFSQDEMAKVFPDAITKVGSELYFILFIFAEVRYKIRCGENTWSQLMANEIRYSALLRCTKVVRKGSRVVASLAHQHASYIHWIF